MAPENPTLFKSTDGHHRMGGSLTWVSNLFLSAQAGQSSLRSSNRQLTHFVQLLVKAFWVVMQEDMFIRVGCAYLPLRAGCPGGERVNLADLAEISRLLALERTKRVLWLVE